LYLLLPDFYTTFRSSDPDDWILVIRRRLFLLFVRGAEALCLNVDGKQVSFVSASNSTTLVKGTALGNVESQEQQRDK